MRSPLSLFALLAAVSLFGAACGGKILDDPNGPRNSGSSTSGGGSSGVDPTPLPAASPTPAPTDTSTPLPPGSPKPTVEDACSAVCDRNGQCGAQQTDCVQRCTDDIYGVSACTSEASAYIHCYADNLEPGCAALPPVCEAAYCAYTRCAGKVVPTYCR